jgi:hypothetical protein
MADENPQSIDVVVPPEHQVAVYANAASVSSQGPFDVTIDFLQLVPGGGTPLPVVVSRVKVSASFLMPLMQSLSNHLREHEEFSHQFEQSFEPPVPPKDEEEES